LTFTYLLLFWYYILNDDKLFCLLLKIIFMVF
jgi:hypothetical protein